MPRAIRVALAFAVAAARSAALSGTYGFLGVISKADTVFNALLNIDARLFLISFTVLPSCAMTFASAAMESFHVPFAVAVADTALRTPSMNVTACAAEYVCPATVKTAFAQ